MLYDALDSARRATIGPQPPAPAPVTPAAPRPRRVAIITLGCKLNQADSEAIERQLGMAGSAVINRPAVADAYIIDTCSVTHVADRKAWHLVRLARRLGPRARNLRNRLTPARLVSPRDGRCVREAL